MIKIVRSSSTNAEVTDYYLDVIGSIVEECGEKKYEETRELKQCDKKDIIVAPTAVDFIKIYFKGYKNIIYWMQGLDLEESFMRNGSKLRCLVLGLITKFAMKKALAIFYVSEEMKKYEENKFRISTCEKSFIMPCFNVSRTEALQKDERKYKKNIFTYVGSLSKWQCFEETLDFYKQIEKIDPNAELKIFTFAEEEAKKIVANKNLKNCIVTSVAPDKMTEALADVKFGFVLREDDPVNRVATPTKLSSYLSAGVIPIFSKYIKDFYNRTINFEYVVPVSDFNPNEKVKKLMIEKINVDKLISEYMNLFESYYNPTYYIGIYKNRMFELLERKNVTK